ncbi:MAG: oligosaccharide flippase family protein, partial [Candidatus Komeilibacteria bacterium]|nr:oligosaccharide flippase family protein [Candidatus Komeilibacteria bacterium]
YRLAWPFALAGIASRLYGYADTFLLKSLAGNAAVGYYSLPYKMTFVFQFIPLSLIATVYPAFASYWQRDQEALSKLFTRVCLYLLYVSLPVTIGISMLAEPIFTTIYGLEYLPSVGAVKILILTLPWLFLNFPLGYLLNACHLQKKNTRNIIIVTVLNVLGNLYFIPRYEFIGASFMSLVSTMMLFVMGAAYARHLVTLDWRLIGGKIMGLIASLVAMWLVIGLIAELSIIVIIPVAMLVYGIMMIVTRTVTNLEIAFLFNSLRKTS